MRQAFASELQRLNEAVDRLPDELQDVRERQAAIAEQVGELQEELAEERRQQALRVEIADLEHQLRLQEPFLRKVVAPGPYQEQDIAAMLAGSPMSQRLQQLRRQL
jgi:chromosome segregation ATPase